MIEFVQRKELKLNQRRKMFVEVCDAIHHGHQHGFIHRDVKSANVPVDQEGHSKVIDFGIVRATETRGGLQTPGQEFRQLMGTPSAMSPEQCDSAGDVDSARTSIRENDDRKPTSRRPSTYADATS